MRQNHIKSSGFDWKIRLFPANSMDRRHACYQGGQDITNLPKIGNANMDEHGIRMMDLEKFLKVDRVVPVDNLNYYLYWVEKFMKGENYRIEKIGQLQKELASRN